MSIFPRWLVEWVKRSPRLLARYRAVQWQWHLLKDWWGTKVWQQTREVTTPLGFKLTAGIHPAYAQMRSGQFEPAETALLSRLLPQADVFIDVGANLGFYTCLARQAGKPVVAFEPQPQNLRCLFRNLEANGWAEGAEVFPLALSARPGLLRLYGASGPSASLIQGWAGYSARFSQTVPVSTLDRVLGGRFSAQRLLIKMDVEGAEYQVLEGALDTLEQVPRPVWLIEICLQEFHPAGSNPDFQRIFELFFSRGYVGYAVAQRLQAVTPDEVRRWVAQGHSAAGSFNYLFLSAEEAAALLAETGPG